MSAESSDAARARPRIPAEIAGAVRRLEIAARRAVKDDLAGDYHSVFKGRGMDFQDVRAYQPGDDPRVIDWNVSARMDELYVKRFVEERELTVLLLVDASGSQLFGSPERTKRECAAGVAALLALSAVANNDRVGLMIFTDRVEAFVPPKKGRKHALRIVSQVLAPDTQGRGTDLAAALGHCARLVKKRAVVFLISDFDDPAFVPPAAEAAPTDPVSRALDLAARRHELVPVWVRDPMEEILPNLGILQVEDPESGELVVVDSGSARLRRAYQERAAARHEWRARALRRRTKECIHVRTDRDYLAPILRHFRRRARRS